MFEYLSQASHYSELISDTLEMTLTGTPIKMQKGAEFEFHIYRFGINHMFCLRVEDRINDEKLTLNQSVGFFKKWSHTMKFEDFKEGETVLHHYIEYELQFNILGKLYDDLYFRHFLKKTFEKLSEKINIKLSSQVK